MPANQIVGLLPGEMFVHRNVANVVVHTDLNCLSAIQFAVDVLQVEHIIVCGHYGCGGVLAALRDDQARADRQLAAPRPGRALASTSAALDALPDETERHDRLCELNVIEQVVNVSQTTVVRDAWARGRKLTVHGWIYGLRDGLLRDLGMCVTAETEVAAKYASGIHAALMVRLRHRGARFQRAEVHGHVGNVPHAHSTQVSLFLQAHLSPLTPSGDGGLRDYLPTVLSRLPPLKSPLSGDATVSSLNFLPPF